MTEFISGYSRNFDQIRQLPIEILQYYNIKQKINSLNMSPFKRQPHKMVRHTQKIRRRICQRIVWVYLAILWGWCLKD